MVLGVFRSTLERHAGENAHARTSRNKQWEINDFEFPGPSSKGVIEASRRVAAASWGALEFSSGWRGSVAGN
eukprot:9021529-Pyramimonas_sp.AAC.1